jgi:hypothetical protein
MIVSLSIRFFGFGAGFLGEGCELARGAVEVFFFAFFGAENFFWAARKVVWVVPTHFGDRCRFVGLVGSKSRRNSNNWKVTWCCGFENLECFKILGVEDVKEIGRREETYLYSFNNGSEQKPEYQNRYK